MSRTVWFAAGAAAGVYTMVRAKRAASNFTPDGIAARAAALGAGMRLFAHEVSAGMSARETELRETLAVPAPAPATPLIGPGAASFHPEGLVHGHG